MKGWKLLLLGSVLLLLNSTPGPAVLFQINVIPEPPTAGEEIPIVGCEWMDIFAHVDIQEPGREWLIQRIRMVFTNGSDQEFFDTPPEGQSYQYQSDFGPPLVLDWTYSDGVMPGNDIVECEWVYWGSIHVGQGAYCQNFWMAADILVPGWQLQSNVLKFHIVPEPSSFLVLGSGLVGLVGFVRGNARRRGVEGRKIRH